ncbi:hypothetical protein L1887_12348 [Cichorium endivia]|nr:hypothetical protein L1887_12348 [Cichorium endivia]
MVGNAITEVITSKSCSKMYSDINCTLSTNSSTDLQPPRSSLHRSASNSPFSGLVICVTGLSKVRLNESLYGVKSFGENYMAKDDLNRIGNGNSCLPIAMVENVKQSNLIQRSRLHSLEEKKRSGSMFSGQTVYVDPDVSAEIRNKVVEAVREEGGLVMNEWSVGQNATRVICESSSVEKYLGHANNLVTPLWVLKTVKEARLQKLVHLSADLARHVGMSLRNVPGGKDRKGGQTTIKPLNPNILLDSINWIMSETSSTAYICSDSSSIDDAKASVLVDANGSLKELGACFVNLLQPLSEREKSKMIFENHFITILFPVDRFGEIGPCSRTFFSNTGFTCSQLLDHVHTFYQENMSTSEIELAIHTDSRHADRLRSIYSTKEVVEVKRIDFLGSRKSFQMLKRVPGDHNKNVYELLTRS